MDFMLIWFLNYMVLFNKVYINGYKEIIVEYVYILYLGIDFFN